MLKKEVSRVLILLISQYPVTLMRVLSSLAVLPLRLEEEGSGDTHILNPFCQNVINSLARVITCAAYACYHVLLCVWYLCERKNES